MTREDYLDISGAIDRILDNIANKDFDTHREKICAAGPMLGFKMWFDEKYKNIGL